jgi:hypothetical protein
MELCGHAPCPSLTEWNGASVFLLARVAGLRSCQMVAMGAIVERVPANRPHGEQLTRTRDVSIRTSRSAGAAATRIPLTSARLMGR